MKTEITKYDRYLRAFARYRVNDQEVDDLIQQTYLRALEANENGLYVDKNKLRSFLLFILHNLIKDYYRTKNRIIHTEKETCENNTYNILYLKDTKKQLKNIKDKYSLPLYLNAQGYRYREISEKLNMKLGTVSSNIKKAKRLLKLKSNYYGNRPETSTASTPNG